MTTDVDSTDVVYLTAPERPPAELPGLNCTIGEAFIELLWQAFKAGAGDRYGTIFACRREFEIWYGNEAAR